MLERYWINDVDEELDGTRNVDGWFAVVDEEAGGEIAYFSSQKAASDYIGWLEQWGRSHV